MAKYVKLDSLVSFLSRSVWFCHGKHLDDKWNNTLHEKNWSLTSSLVKDGNRDKLNVLYLGKGNILIFTVALSRKFKCPVFLQS